MMRIELTSSFILLRFQWSGWKILMLVCSVVIDVEQLKFLYEGCAIDVSI
jgi:hypothetical protein